MAAPAAPSNIVAAVAAQAQKYGVPQDMWETIAYVESGYNPNAIGDNGTSYGLFQLHTPGGQGDAAIQAGYTKQQLLDPAVNAAFAMPSIGNAWSNLKSSFGTGTNFSWWEQFAASSGHPGGTVSDPTTQTEAALLMQAYSGKPTTVSAQGTVPIQSSGNPITDITQAFSAIQNLFTGVQSLFTQINTVQQAVPSMLIRIGLFLLIITLIIVGFVLVANSEGI